MDSTKRRFLELFVLGVPVYRQRFRALASAPAIERFYRLVRACCVSRGFEFSPFVGFENSPPVDGQSLGSLR
jgi:transposase